MDAPFYVLSSGDETTDGLSSNTSLSGPSHDTSSAQYHVTDIAAFASHLNLAAKSAFPNRGRSRYDTVNVCLIRWEDDDLNVEPELERLDYKFQDYGFSTNRWLIPCDDSHLELMSKTMEFVRASNTDRNLFVVYYGGHGLINSERQAEWVCKEASVNWSAIQTVFANSKSDVLLLLDTCAAAASTTVRPRYGVMEAIVASGFNAKAPPPGEHSFTNTLIEVLDDWINQGSFSASCLHTEILLQLKMKERKKGREGTRLEWCETPIHINYIKDPKRLGIELCRTNVLLSEGATIPGIRRPTSFVDPMDIDYNESNTFPTVLEVIGSPGSYPGAYKVPHVLLKIGLEEDQSFLNADAFLRWIKQVPLLAKWATIEAAYPSLSTLIILSVPMPVWNMLPDHPACSFLGYIKGPKLKLPISPWTQQRLSDAIPYWMRRVNQDEGIPDIPVDSSEPYSFENWVQKVKEKAGNPGVESVSDSGLFSDSEGRPNPGNQSIGGIDSAYGTSVMMDISTPREVKWNSGSSVMDMGTQREVQWTPETTFLDSPTEPLDEAFLERVTYHHRIYQQYAITNQTYFVPIDEDEIVRLHIMHVVFNKIFGRLIFPPLTRPRRILDCGYGTASWATEVADENPRCEVIGIDINPSMASAVLPENLYLQVDDLNHRFTFPADYFDLVHSQMMATGIHVTRWSQYVLDIFRVTKPGGWCQMVEMDFNIRTGHRSLTEPHALREWSRMYLESLHVVKDLRVHLRLETLLRNAGFTDVEARMIPLYTCGWSTDQRNHDIGETNRENIRSLLSSHAIYPFTQILGMSLVEAQLLIGQARVEAADPSFQAYFPLYVFIGRKPRTETVRSSLVQRMSQYILG